MAATTPKESEHSYHGRRRLALSVLFINTAVPFTTTGLAAIKGESSPDNLATIAYLTEGLLTAVELAVLIGYWGIRNSITARIRSRQ